MPPGFYWVGCISTWLVFVVPTLAMLGGLGGLGAHLLGSSGAAGPQELLLWTGTVAASVAALAQQREVRMLLAEEAGVPPRWWWLVGLGGLILLGLQLASAWKTITGLYRKRARFSKCAQRNDCVSTV